VRPSSTDTTGSKTLSKMRVVINEATEDHMSTAACSKYYGYSDKTKCIKEFLNYTLTET